MTVYDVPHIALVESMANGLRYRLTTEAGYHMYMPERGAWFTCTLFPSNYDWTKVQVLPTSELPEGAVIMGNVPNDEQVM